MITVIGSINLDLIATVSRLPGPGETVSGTGFSSAPGGKGANQALAAEYILKQGDALEGQVYNVPLEIHNEIAS